MAIPDFQSLMLPVLQVLREAETAIRIVDVEERLVASLDLSEEDQAEVLPSGQRRLYNRTSWALMDLFKAGLVDRPRRGNYVLTQRGQEVLAAPPPRIDRRFLSQPEPNGQETGDAIPEAGMELSDSLLTPHESIEFAVEELNRSLREELLDQILALDPAAFERLIIALMRGMGYGGRGTSEHVGRTGDGGVDGIVNEDTLGLDVIYLQAKRYRPDIAVGLDALHGFGGALDERHANKGVFVTTSRFTQPARDYARNTAKRLGLIDGDKLTQLMVDHGVAVRVEQTFELKRIDTDFLSEL